MLINGKEYGLFYDVEAHCEYEDFIIKNPEVGKATATIELAIIMNREFNKENGIKEPALRRADIARLPRADIARLPYYEYKELEAAVDAQIKLNSERTVEAAPGKTKAAGKGN